MRDHSGNRSRLRRRGVDPPRAEHAGGDRPALHRHRRELRRPARRATPMTPALRVVRSEVQRLKALIDTMTELQRSGRPFCGPRFMDIGATVRATVKRAAHDVRRHRERDDRRTAAHRARMVGSDRRRADRQQPALQRAEVRPGPFGAPDRAARRPPGVSIAVRDQGAGIGAADRLRIFERNKHAPADAGRRHGPGAVAGARAGDRARRPRDGAQPQGPRHDVHRSAARRSRRCSAAESGACSIAPPAAAAQPDAHRLEQAGVPRRDSPPTGRTGWPGRRRRRRCRRAREIDVAPTSTMISPSLTANLKASWPSRTRKSNDASRGAVVGAAAGR